MNNQIRRNALWLRLGLVLVMLEIGINLACIPALGAAETNDLIAQLKAAQEHPAIVKKLVFRERGVPNQPGFDRDGFQTFFAKWQSNAFILIQVASTNDAPAGIRPPTTYDPNLVKAGRFDNYYWFVANDSFQDWMDKGELPKDDKNPVFGFNEIMANHVSSVLNRGVRDVASGSIKWNGDSFQTPSEFAPGTIVKGTMDSVGGRPTALQLWYGQYRWLVSYDYSHSIGTDILPWRWTIAMFEDGKWTKVSEVQIVSIEIGDKTEPREAFLPAQMQQLGKVANHLVLTNGGLYRVVGNKLDKVVVGIGLHGQ